MTELEDVYKILKKIKSDISEFGFLVLLVFISTCTTCNMVGDVEKQQKKTNERLDSILIQLKANGKY